MTPIDPNRPDSSNWFLNQDNLSLQKLSELWNSSNLSNRHKTFVMLASRHVLRMNKQDKSEEEMLPQTADRLVTAGLALALGPNITKKPEAFNKMKAIIQKKIMTNPDYRAKLEKFISILERFDRSV